MRRTIAEELAFHRAQQCAVDARVRAAIANRDATRPRRYFVGAVVAIAGPRRGRALGVREGLKYDVVCTGTCAPGPTTLRRA